jgi:hypothetical protein
MSSEAALVPAANSCFSYPRVLSCLLPRVLPDGNLKPFASTAQGQT